MRPQKAPLRQRPNSTRLSRTTRVCTNIAMGTATHLQSTNPPWCNTYSWFTLVWWAIHLGSSLHVDVTLCKCWLVKYSDTFQSGSSKLRRRTLLSTWRHFFTFHDKWVLRICWQQKRAGRPFSISRLVWGWPFTMFDTSRRSFKIFPPRGISELETTWQVEFPEMGVPLNRPFK